MRSSISSTRVLSPPTPDIEVDTRLGSVAMSDRIAMSPAVEPTKKLLSPSATRTSEVSVSAINFVSKTSPSVAESSPRPKLDRQAVSDVELRAGRVVRPDVERGQDATVLVENIDLEPRGRPHDAVRGRTEGEVARFAACVDTAERRGHGVVIARDGDADLRAPSERPDRAPTRDGEVRVRPARERLQDEVSADVLGDDPVRLRVRVGVDHGGHFLGRRLGDLEGSHRGRT